MLTFSKRWKANGLLTDWLQRGIMVTDWRQTGYEMGKQLGLYVQGLRQQRGESIRQLGNEIGLSAAHLSLIERGQREVSIQVLYPLVQALDGDFRRALSLLAMDAGIPEEAL